ncbi:MAG: type II toxin-antitoxin system RelE/ParE family toxin [Geminicoccaceae bacterium]|nr:type II toxin-antitoxin system RelE/ParE family toxin [Geminicoccaceae bacterium]
MSVAAAPLYELTYSDAALTYLAAVPTLKLRKQIAAKAANLRFDPHPPKHKCLKGMMDSNDRVFRVRSGDYRILYVVREQIKQIAILDINDRKDVYR